MLAALRVDYRAVAPDVEELREGGAPEDLVVENARRKALAGLQLASAEPDERSLGVDTEVVLDGRLLGKAADAAGARERLRALSGRTHEVLSGVALVGGERPALTGVARSRVTFAELDAATLERYLASEEWRDRAGAYAIQGLGSLLVDRVEGDFANVVGLPLRLLVELAPDLFPANPGTPRG
jgi:septum formation protein